MQQLMHLYRSKSDHFDTIKMPPIVLKHELHIYWETSEHISALITLLLKEVILRLPKLLIFLGRVIGINGQGHFIFDAVNQAKDLVQVHTSHVLIDLLL